MFSVFSPIEHGGMIKVGERVPRGVVEYREPTRN
jgi:hypothetical protein